ncbi:MAG: ISAzo13 family transposase [bacterium]|nr:ISAzo13 family transposase [bacterium]
MSPLVDERQRRLMAGGLAHMLGRGGQARVTEASGMSRSTVIAGMKEVTAGVEPSDRVRAPGAGAKPLIETQPGLLAALDELVHPDTRGNPMSLLRWTSKSTAKLAKELIRKGFQVSDDTVGRLLKAMGYSLQSPAKVKEGTSHPDRDGQFRYLHGLAGEFTTAGDPVISVDTKKKELVGPFDNGGVEYQPTAEPVEVNSHDFPDPVLGRAIPYGIYDETNNEGWVTVGDVADTSEFAVNAIRSWWNQMGAHRFPDTTRLLITADAGGSNGHRVRAWKKHLATLAAETGLEITVCHYPPGTSKWNRIEHRMFSFITMNWRSRPLTSYRTIIELIAATTTETGLQIRAERDTEYYATGIKTTDAEMAELPLTRHTWHPDWNYTLHATPNA